MTLMLKFILYLRGCELRHFDERQGGLQECLRACSMGKIGLYDLPKIVVSRILDALRSRR